MTYVLLAIGVLFMIFPFLLSTGNMTSALLFKVFPFTSGVFIAIYATDVLGLITIN